MYRIVIADDEPFIIKGLRVIVDWDSLNAKIVGEAENGRELMQLIKELTPDIVISDIEMPELKGLDIIRKIKEQKLNTKVILLSAYQEFSYAKDAITYGAIDYLVKPVAREELVQSIRKAEKLIERENSSVVINEHAGGENNNHFVGKDQNVQYEKLIPKFRELNIDTEGRIFTGVCFTLAEETAAAINNNTKFELLRFAIFKSIQDYIEKRKYGIVIKRSERRSNTIFVLPGLNSSSVLEQEIEVLKEQLYGQYHAKIIVGIGDSTADIKKLKYAYKTAKFSLELYYFQQSEIIYYHKINREYNQSLEEFEKESKKFIELVTNRIPDWKEALKKCMDMIEDIHYGNRYAAENLCGTLITDLYRELAEYKMLTDSEKQQFDEINSKLRLCGTFRQLRGYLNKCLTDCLQELFDKPPSESTVIKQVKCYIMEHYAEEINLEQISGMVFMNQYYFSSFFKKETGQNFKNYLAEVRMKEAKKLLLESEKKTYEIAEAVGYHDVRSFSDKFKEIYGANPSTFKKMISKS